MIKQVQFMNRIDEQGRFCGLETFLVPKSQPVMDTHGISYLEGRRLRTEMGQTQGFDKSIAGYMLKHFGYITHRDI